MNRPTIEISQMSAGQISTLYRPAFGHTPMFIGIVLASATRVIAEAFLKEMKLGPEHREPIERTIAEAYLRDNSGSAAREARSL